MWGVRAEQAHNADVADTRQEEQDVTMVVRGVSVDHTKRKGVEKEGRVLCCRGVPDIGVEHPNTLHVCLEGKGRGAG